MGVWIPIDSYGIILYLMVVLFFKPLNHLNG